MSVRAAFLIAHRTQPAQTRKEALLAHVTVDTLELELHALILMNALRAQTIVQPMGFAPTRQGASAVRANRDILETALIALTLTNAVWTRIIATRTQLAQTHLETSRAPVIVDTQVQAQHAQI